MRFQFSDDGLIARADRARRFMVAKTSMPARHRRPECGDELLLPERKSPACLPAELSLA